MQSRGSGDEAMGVDDAALPLSPVPWVAPAPAPPPPASAALAAGSPVRRSGGWYPALIGALAGAALAIGVMEHRLEAELALRPPVMVADFTALMDGLAHGGNPNVLKVLADQYTAQAEVLARDGVLVLRSDALVGAPRGAIVPQDPRLLSLLLSLASPERSPAAVTSQQSNITQSAAVGAPIAAAGSSVAAPAVGLRDVTNGDGVAASGNLAPADAASLMSALRAGGLKAGNP